MSAILQMLAADQTTVITSLNDGNVATPGTIAAHKLGIKNNGDQDALELTLTITPVGTNDGSTYAQIAPDVAGSPGTFQTTPLSFGTLVTGATIAYWLKEVVPSGRTADQNPRRFDLVASANTT